MTRRLLKEEITYSLAKERDVNILHQLGYVDQQCRFFTYLHDRREWMKAVVAHHLDLRSTAMCHVAEMEDCLRGSFNVCIPITLEGWNSWQQAGRRVILRFPLPTASAICSDQGMGTKKFSVRPVHMHGSNRIALMFQFQIYTVLRYQLVKLYDICYFGKGH